MKKIAVISDIHCHLFLFEKILEDCNQRKIDHYLFLGDYISDGPNSNVIINKIKKISNDVIYGNREYDLNQYDGKTWIDNPRYINKLYAYNDLREENRVYLKSLSLYKIVEIENRRICISHGTPYKVDGQALADSYDLFSKLIEDFDCDVYLFGHQHRPFYTEYQNRLFINVGSVSTPLDGRATSKYGVLEIGEKIKYELIEYSYSFEEVKNYYTESDYFKKCWAWSNLLIYALRDGIDYRRRFISHAQAYAKAKDLDPKKDFTEDVWYGLFFDFMEKNNLKVFLDKSN